MSELIRTKMVKTRKQHYCHFCLRTFPAGTIMQVGTSRDDESIYDAYCCQDCQRIVDDFSDDLIDDGFYYEGCVNYFLREIGFNGTPAEFKMKRCSRCKGKGFKLEGIEKLPGGVVEINCPKCKGSGMEPEGMEEL